MLYSFHKYSPFLETFEQCEVRAKFISTCQANLLLYRVLHPAGSKLQFSHSWELFCSCLSSCGQNSHYSLSNWYLAALRGYFNYNWSSSYSVLELELLNGIFLDLGESHHLLIAILKGQTQCTRLPPLRGLGEGLMYATLPLQVERLYL